MTKRKIDFCEYAGTIIRAMQQGTLLTTKVGDKVNSMAIGWGTIGIQWEKPIFIAFVVPFLVLLSVTIFLSIKWRK